MRIIIDAMSGDNAPFEIVKGALEASKIYDIDLVLTGNKDTIEKIADELGYSLEGVEIIDTDVVITMEDDPNCVVRSKKNSSMSLGLYELKENADAFVTAGNTGAMFVGASLIVRPVKGIRRPCLATILPFPEPLLLLDCGANVNVLPEYLETWACMGSLYMEKIMKISDPRVGLLNNGAEEHKGTPIMVETHRKLKASKEINFIGNVEARDIPFGACDVLVTDGFTGNIVLKYTEGFGKFFMKTLKKMYSKNTRSKMSFLAMKDQIMDLRRQFDAGEYGGAPLLGLSKPVIKAHGSSDARDIKNAVRVAVAFAETGVVEEIGASASRLIAARNAEKKENTESES
ncbi:MAG: phosphate acyltransferase PlsX [Ruminococcaceae bacterium]|nr:phosphate acyltransferase PlsX [Oscillospiraceae bacterium]